MARSVPSRRRISRPPGRSTRSGVLAFSLGLRIAPAIRFALLRAVPPGAHPSRIGALREGQSFPDGKMLIPGVIESTSNFVEHPELIAQRIARYANLVGRENVVAGSDCGFGTWVGQSAVDPDVVWAKMSAMADGARIASRQFWKS